MIIPAIASLGHSYWGQLEVELCLLAMFVDWPGLQPKSTRGLSEYPHTPFHDGCADPLYIGAAMSLYSRYISRGRGRKT